MDFGISTQCFGTTPLTPELLDRLRLAEFTQIELFGTLPGFDYHRRSFQSFSGVRVLIETLRNRIASFERIAEFKTAAQLPDVGICYDTGHGEPEGAADAIHMDDNDGEKDGHLWPFEGTRNWPALIEKIVRSSFGGTMILEAGNDRLDKAVESRSRLRDLTEEATNSIEEFRLKYKLPVPRQEENE